MTAWWVLVVGPLLASALYVAVEFWLARIRDDWESSGDERWRIRTGSGGRS